MMAFGSGKSFSERANTLDTSASGRLRVSQHGQFWWFIIIIYFQAFYWILSLGLVPFSRCLREIARAWRQGRKEKTSETLMVVISHSLLSLRIFIPSASWLGPTPILSPPPLLLSERVYSVAHLSACCETIERGRNVARPKESGACRSLLGGGAGVRCATVQQFKRLAGARFWIGDLFTTTDGE